MSSGINNLKTSFRYLSNVSDQRSTRQDKYARKVNEYEKSEPVKMFILGFVVQYTYIHPHIFESVSRGPPFIQVCDIMA